MYRLTLLLVFACALGAISAYPSKGGQREKRGEYGGYSGHSSNGSQQHHHGYHTYARRGRSGDVGLDESEETDDHSDEPENGDEQVDISQLHQSQVDFEQKREQETIKDITEDAKLLFTGKDSSSKTQQVISEVAKDQKGQSKVSACSNVESKLAVNQSESGIGILDIRLAIDRNCHSKVNVGNKVKSEHVVSQGGSADFSNSQKAKSKNDTVNKGRFEFTNSNEHISQIIGDEKSQAEPIVGHSVEAGIIGEHKNHYNYTHKETPKISLDYKEHTKEESQHQKPFRLDEDNYYHHAHHHHHPHHHDNKEMSKIAHGYNEHGKVAHGYEESFHSTTEKQSELSSGQTETPQIAVDTKEQIETEGASKTEPEITVVQTGQAEIASSTQDTPVVSIAQEEQAEFHFSQKGESEHDNYQKPLKDYDYHNHHPHYHHHHQHRHHDYPHDHGHQGHGVHDGPSVVYGL